MENNPPKEIEVVHEEQHQPLVVNQGEPGGAIVLPIHVKRSMKVYPIQEQELSSLQTLSSDKTFWSSVGSGALVWLLTCCWEWTQLPKGTDYSLSSKLFMVALASVSLFSFGRAGWRRWTINQRLSKILSESSTE